MICLRHDHCRRALLERTRTQIQAWPTQTAPRAFVTISLGTLGASALMALIPADLYVIYWCFTRG